MNKKAILKMAVWITIAILLSVVIGYFAFIGAKV